MHVHTFILKTHKHKEQDYQKAPLNLCVYISICAIGNLTLQHDCLESNLRQNQYLATQMVDKQTNKCMA